MLLEALLGQPISAVLPAEVAQPVLQAAEAARRTGTLHTIEYALPQRQPVERVLPAVPSDAQPRHSVDTRGLDELQCGAVHLAEPLADGLQIFVPLLLLGFMVALLEPVLDRGQHADDVLL